MNNEEYLVWWTTAYDIDAFGIGTTLFEQWSAPEYLKDVMESRRGRPGRGRLWIPKTFPTVEVTWIDGVADSLYLELCGGIVFKKSDIHWLKGAPGVFTTLDMKVLHDFENVCHVVIAPKDVENTNAAE